MIDLTKSQLITEDVKVLVWDDDPKPDDLEPRCLALIDHRCEYPFIVWDGEGGTGKDNAYRYHYCAGFKYCALYKEPEKRLMTREEILGFVTHNPRILVSANGNIWRLPQYWDFTEPIEVYEYVRINRNGEHITEPSKFWKEK